MEESRLSGDYWKAKDSFMVFIYIPVFTVSLASKKNRPKVLAILPPLCPFGGVLSFISIMYFPTCPYSSTSF